MSTEEEQDGPRPTRLVMPPWEAWRSARADLNDEELCRRIEQLPFHVYAHGQLEVTTLVQIAAGGSVMDVCASLAQRARQGLINWSRITQTLSIDDERAIEVLAPRLLGPGR